MRKTPLPKFGPPKINPGSGRLVTHIGKGGSQELLPHRDAMNQLTKGDPWQRSVGNYAKLTPSGATVPSYQDIIDMASMGASARPK
jgi:hypothetical protein